MKTKFALKLDIPQPCHENWDKMSPNEKGRHCASCNKTVVDFSLYSDRELVEFFKNTSGNVCGRLHNYQVNRTILVTEQPNRSLFYKFFMGSAIASWLGLITGTAHAQINNSAVPVSLNDAKKKPDSAKKESTEAGAQYLKGTLVDAKNHQPLPFANVVIEVGGTQIDGAITDIDGNFRIMLPDDFTHKVILKCIYEGYTDIIKEIKEGTKSITVQMKTNPDLKLHTVGAMVISCPSRPFNTTYKGTYDQSDSPYTSPRPRK